MLSNFVGGINNITHSNHGYLKSQQLQQTGNQNTSLNNNNNNDVNAPSTMGSLFYFSSSYGNTAIATNNNNNSGSVGTDVVGGSGVGGGGGAGGMNTIGPKSDYSPSGQKLNAQQLQQLRMYKRRSITSSPVRYNFNSKSSPPVTMRIIDTANLMQQQVQQSIENTNQNEAFDSKDTRHSMFSNQNKKLVFENLSYQFFKHPK
jgi:hypothetical protein